ncbi:hypothetical protein Lsan_4174 [Legionella santicrucis]|uniref:Methyltransferase domain protein n=1 Tax=Legionella santicrucis TaxID=45074 RepID=A0A0W0YAS9_9GAMM|nr:hypothetical protein [Legionella santicrucis]KTD53764.1 hypothetical protein Lsan_4174 [Legionella santicrucis]
MHKESIHTILEQFSKTISHLSSVEKENITRDFKLLLSFIESGEYKNTELLHRNRFDTQKRTYEFFSYIQGYNRQAMDWFEFLQNIPLKEITSILDIGPGFSPKLALALKRANYEGLLTLLDKSEIALNGLKQFLEMMGVSFDIRFLCDDFFNGAHCSYQLVAANHLFDDLIIDAYCSSKQMPTKQIYEDETVFIKTTEDIMLEFDKTRFLMSISSVFSKTVAKDGYLLFRNYKGLTEQALELSNWHEYVSNFFEDVILLLQKEGMTILERKNGFVLLKNLINRN